VGNKCVIFSTYATMMLRMSEKIKPVQFDKKHMRHQGRTVTLYGAAGYIFHICAANTVKELILNAESN
jgi:hypothetical protein